MIDIFDYSDYRKFISDYQQMKNASNPAFSFRYYAKKAGINSSSFYPQIIKGVRNLTKNTIIKTCTAFKLSDQQAEYFENLVFFNQAKTIKEKNIYFDRLIEKQKLRNVKKIKQEQYEYFSAWYHCIIREAIVFVKFDGDYGRLARFLHPAITEAQVKESVQLLLQLGFVKKEGDRYVHTEPLLATRGAGDFQIHRLMSFQIEMLKMAIEAYDRWKQDKRLTSATTFSFSHKNYPQFVEILRDCRSRLMKLAMEDEHPDQVYILSMNFFPMTNEYTESDADE
jgi:uncharacterized protein (TIGR02147 family)